MGGKNGVLVGKIVSRENGREKAFNPARFARGIACVSVISSSLLVSLVASRALRAQGGAGRYASSGVAGGWGGSAVNFDKIFPFPFFFPFFPLFSHFPFSHFPISMGKWENGSPF